MENRREIKFCCWDKVNNRMIYPASSKNDTYLVFEESGWFVVDHLSGKNETILKSEDGELMQFTGKKCFNNKEVYECDILFYEEQTDDGDERFYLIVTYINEWCMFATLHLEEYHKYLREGVNALDEVLYWTYPIEESEEYHYAGNVFETPHLLEPKKEEKQ